MIENLGDLDKFLGKYVDIFRPDGEGMSGWLVKIGPVVESIETNVNGSQLSEYRMLEVDYGYGMAVGYDDSIAELTPPNGYPKPTTEGE